MINTELRELKNSKMAHDIFISHASEDKDDLVRPLAEALQRLSVSVWHDEFSLQIGDTLSR
jgi:hypothetical protein